MFNLAVETTGRVGGIALGRDDDIVAAAAFNTAFNHAVELLPTVDGLCRAHGCEPSALSELYVSGGPGSFTGLRIGITLARTLAWSMGVRVVRVATLDAVAQNALDANPPPLNLGVVLDAKRKSVFAAAYRLIGNRYFSTAPAAECDPVTFLDCLPKPAAVTGEGVPFIAEALTRVMGGPPSPDPGGLFVLPESLFRARAEVVYRLGRERAAAGDFDDPAQLIPIYVRRPEAEEVWDRRHRSPDTR
ncbi:MAG: tRNA (adenosine(37)-N6)-threonylcarbamoyltransferase complex dimerization subunit type 1 TsaB [Phycisphaerales bacterium]|nr:tRNA (adenosine(37)-N6)-threonylcarbamoyltransferase complex dimerization subunit type 1 TsaB [Phycisphaerales bacterium]